MVKVDHSGPPRAKLLDIMPSCPFLIRWIPPHLDDPLLVHESTDITGIYPTAAKVLGQDLA
jgi:hypothetical protein